MGKIYVHYLETKYGIRGCSKRGCGEHRKSRFHKNLDSATKVLKSADVKIVKPNRFLYFCFTVYSSPEWSYAVTDTHSKQILKERAYDTTMQSTSSAVLQ